MTVTRCLTLAWHTSKAKFKSEITDDERRRVPFDKWRKRMIDEGLDISDKAKVVA